MNVNGAVEVNPHTWFVARVDLVALHLPRTYPGKGVVVIAELEISHDPQGIHGNGCKAQQCSLLADSRDVASGVVVCGGTRKSQRDEVACRGIDGRRAGSRL